MSNANLLRNSLSYHPYIYKKENYSSRNSKANY